MFLSSLLAHVLHQSSVILTFLVCGLLGAEALVYRLRLEFDLLGDNPFDADWLPEHFPADGENSVERYFSLILRLVRPFTARQKH